MRIPTYVPAPAREFIETELKATNESGLAAFSESATSYAAAIAQQIEHVSRSKDKSSLPALRERLENANVTRDEALTQFECLRRLACDRRMQGPYNSLYSVLTSQDQWATFLCAASGALCDWRDHQDRLRRRKQLRDEIAKKARELAILLREAHRNGGLTCPPVFHYTLDLLLKTKRSDRRTSSADNWTYLRDWLSVGSSRGEHTGAAVSDEVLKHDELVRTFVRNGLDGAPEPSLLIDALADAAESWTPGPTGHLRFGVASRKRNSKTDYLHALISLLEAENIPVDSPTMMHAIAIVAAVVINDENVDITYDDVRKAVAFNHKNPTDDSSKE